MKSSSNFEPIYLQDAKRHIQWLYSKIKDVDKTDKIQHNKNISFFKKVTGFLKRIF